MNSKFLHTCLALGLVALAAPSWATVYTEPLDGTTKWQNIESLKYSTDNGTTWANLTNSTTLFVGQQVEFQITMHKNYLGNHYADLAKVWVDQDGLGFTQSDAVIFGYDIVNGSQPALDRTNEVAKSPNNSFSFTSGAINVSSSMLSGGLELLARVTCSETLAGAAGRSWADQWDPTYVSPGTAPEATNMTWYKTNFSYNANYSGGQGESTLVNVKVTNRVPEPGTLALFAVAMVGLGLRRKQSACV